LIEELLDHQVSPFYRSAIGRSDRFVRRDEFQRLSLCGTDKAVVHLIQGSDLAIANQDDRIHMFAPAAPISATFIEKQ
jgi:hypothetical protein